MSIVSNTEELQKLLRVAQSLPTATSVQRKSGSFTTDANGFASVDCGWQPDIVYLQGQTYTSGGGSVYDYSASMNFAEENRVNISETTMWCDDGILDILWQRDSAGFSTHIGFWNYEWVVTAYADKTLNYVAVKYT